MKKISLNVFLSHFGWMVFIKRRWMKADWVLRESKVSLQPKELKTHFPQYYFGLYSPHKLSNFNHYPH